MSANPRIVVTQPGVSVTWDGGAVTYWLTAGTIVDCAPGSALESAIGAGNLTSPDASDLAGDPTGAAGGITN